MWRNPVRSEAEAFRFLLLTLAAFAAVALASVAGGFWAALAVWTAVSAGAVLLYTRREAPRRLLRTAPAHAGPAGERRLLVVAQQPLPGSAVERLAGRGDRVLVVAPAAPSPVERWLSAVDGARLRARGRADEAVRELRAADVVAAGTVGDEDPLQAVEDALRTFGGDEILVAGGDGDALADRIRERFALPVARVPG